MTSEEAQAFLDRFDGLVGEAKGVIDRLDELTGELSNERAEIESAISRGRDVVSKMRRAAKAASEAAGMIGNEVSRLRRA